MVDLWRRSKAETPYVDGATLHDSITRLVKRWQKCKLSCMDANNHTSKLQAGRQALSDAGIAPRSKGKLRTAAALHWVYRWGWSSASTLEAQAGSERSGLAARLVKSGLLNRTKTEAAGGSRDVPQFVFTLTEAGVAEVERTLSDEAELLPYDIDPYRINQALLRHDTMAQNATAKVMATGQIADFETPRQLAAKSERNVKQHDAIWIKTEGSRFGIEIELSAKWDRKLDEFVLGCLQSVQSKAVAQVLIVTDSKAIQSRYRAAFAPGATYSVWERDARRYWQPVREAEVPEALSRRVVCNHIER